MKLIAILNDRYITVKTIQKLQLPAKALPLIQWRDDLKREMTDLDGLLFEQGTLKQCRTCDFTQKSELIVMGKAFLTSHLSALFTLLNEEGVDTILIYSPELIAEVTTIRCALSSFPDGLKAKLDRFAKGSKLDFSLMAQFPDWSKPGLVLMDMDSTTIQIECIDEIARLHGVGEQVSAVTALAMQGKLDFNESLRTRVSKLEDMPVSILKEVADNMPLMPGLQLLIAGLKQAGWKVAIASGGFNYFADRLKQDHGFDFTIANTLELDGDHLTGRVVGEIVNADVKARTLNDLALQYSIESAQTVAIGDGANDLVMMAASALGIAIHAKPIVQEKAATSLNHLDLEGALAILSANHCASWS